MSNIRFQGNPSGTGTLTIASPNTNSDFTLNLPTANGTIPLLATVTNNGVMFIDNSGQPTSGSGLVFNSSGNLGIGTSSPSSNLDIRGSSSRIRLDGSAASFQILSRNTADSTTNPLIFDADTYTFNRAGSTQMLLNASGNLGLGTTSPTSGYRLDVRGNVIAYADSGNVGVVVASGTNANGAMNAIAGTGLNINTDATNRNITFSTNSVERARIDSSGNVGIGTSSPSQRLDVRDAAAGIYLSSTTGTNQAALQINNSGGNFYFGLENSAGNNFNTGTAYAGALWRSGANPICFVNNSTERMRIDGSGNVGIGTSSPTSSLVVSGAATGSPTVNGVHLGIQSNYATIEMCSSVGSLIDFTTSGTDFRGRLLYDNAGNFMAFSTNGVERARFSATGQMSTTTGTGSVALAYDARAWVNFNGTGTVAIRASGNVSSITDNGTGDYTVNFSTAMPDANYSVAGNIADVVSGINCILKVVAPNVASAPTLKTASQVRIGTNSDSNETNVTIFR